MLTRDGPGKVSDGMPGGRSSRTAAGAGLLAWCVWGTLLTHPGYLGGLGFQRLLEEAVVSHPDKVLKKAKPRVHGAP